VLLLELDAALELLALFMLIELFMFEELLDELLELLLPPLPPGLFEHAVRMNNTASNEKNIRTFFFIPGLL
jgi:hypothetical protein